MLNKEGRRVTRPTIWTPEKCEAALEDYKADCKQAKTAVTREGYQEWEKTHDAPSHTTIETVLGPWAEAIKKNTAEECKSAIRNYDAHCQKIGQNVSALGYRGWRKAQQPRPPSVSTILRIFDSWNNARRASVADLSQVDFNPIIE